MGNGSLRLPVRIGLAIPLLLAQLGCGNGPTEPDMPVVGSWVGTLVDDRAGSGVVELNLENDYDLHLVGTWSVTVAQTTVGGPLTGTAAFTPMLLSVRCGTSAGTMFLTLENGRLSGSHTFFTSTCPPLSTGAVELSKR